MRATLILFVLIAAAPAVHAQVVVPRGRSAIRGVVTDTTGRPMTGAIIVRSGSPDTVRADSLGRYLIEGLRLGRHIFTVRSPGYDPIEMEISLPFDTTLVVNVPLEPVRVDSAVAAKLERNGFEQRRRRSAATQGTHASFLGPGDIASSAARVGQLLEGLRDLTIRPGRGGIEVVVGADQRCMTVWIEGQRVENVFPPSTFGGQSRRSDVRYTGLEELMQPSQVAAIEVYPRPLDTPPQFSTQARGSSDCGALVFWIK